jgi:hypothetical protein
MTDPSLDPILAYLREHSGRYSLSALREQLLQTGHDQDLVDRAIAIYQHEQNEQLVLAQWQKSRARGPALFCGLLLLAVALAILVPFGLCSYFYSKGMSGQ